MTKIVACSDRLGMNTSYSQQMDLLMRGMQEYKWHYVGLGDPSGHVMKMPNSTITHHPSWTPDPHYSDEVYILSRKEDPELIFLYEDVQNLVQHASMSFNIPRIYWFPWDNEEWSPSLSNLLKKAEVPVCISKNTQNLAKEHGYNIDQVYNICDDKVFKPISKDEKIAFKKRMGIPPDKKILLYVGRLTIRKNVESLYAMVAELKKKRDDFLFMSHSDPLDPGRSSEPFIETVTRGIENTMFQSKIQWDKGLVKKELNNIYNIADVFVSAHGGEGFGLPACEAGLCKKPFVMTDYTTTKEFGGDGTHGLGVNILTHRGVRNIMRPVPDHVDFARKVDYLLDDDDLRLVMGLNFRDWVLENCSTDVIFDKFRKVFQRVRCKRVTINEQEDDKDILQGKS